VLVNLAGGDVVVSVESDVQEALVVAKIKIHFTTIIQNKNFPCRNKMNKGGTKEAVSAYHAHMEKMCQHRY
jgi:hypothetical protein